MTQFELLFSNYLSAFAQLTPAGTPNNVGAAALVEILSLTICADESPEEALVVAKQWLDACVQSRLQQKGMLH